MWAGGDGHAWSLLVVFRHLLSYLRHHWPDRLGHKAVSMQVSNQKYATMSSDDKGSAAAPKRVESDVYDRQIRLWGADAQVSVLGLFSVPLSLCYM